MDNNKKIALNSVIIFVRLCVVSLVGLIASRLVLDALGASDFGLYNVVGSIVTLLNVFNTAMLSTTYRYIAYEVGKKDGGEPNKVFNACFAIHACFAIFILVLGLGVGDWYINNYLNVDPGKISDAHFVFHASLITAVLSTLLVPYNGLIVAFEKFSINAVIDVVTNLIRLVAIVLFIYSDGNRLRLYSIILLLCHTISSLSYFVYSLVKHRAIIKFTIVKELEIYKGMFSYAFWTLFGAVAIIGKAQGSKILINYFFGTLVNAAYAVANQIEGFVLNFAKSLSNAAIPQITKNYSGGNSKRSLKLACYISKYTFFLMSLVAFPVILELDFLLGLWLKEVPVGATIFCKLVILNALLGCLGEGIPALVNATGNIKIYQLVYQTFNFLGLPIAFIFYKLGYNQYSIIIIYCIITFLCAFVRLFLLKRIFNFDIGLFIKKSYSKILYVSIPLVIAYLLYDPSTFTVIGHLVGFALAEIYLIGMILLFGTDEEERPMIKQYVESALARIKRK